MSDIGPAGRSISPSLSLMDEEVFVLSRLSSDVAQTEDEFILCRISPPGAESRPSSGFSTRADQSRTSPPTYLDHICEETPDGQDSLLIRIRTPRSPEDHDDRDTKSQLLKTRKHSTSRKHSKKKHKVHLPPQDRSQNICSPIVTCSNTEELPLLDDFGEMQEKDKAKKTKSAWRKSFPVRKKTHHLLEGDLNVVSCSPAVFDPATEVQTPELQEKSRKKMSAWGKFKKNKALGLLEEDGLLTASDPSMTDALTLPKDKAEGIHKKGGAKHKKHVRKHSSARKTKKHQPLGKDEKEDIFPARTSSTTEDSTLPDTETSDVYDSGRRGSLCFPMITSNADDMDLSENTLRELQEIHEIQKKMFVWSKHPSAKKNERFPEEEHEQRFDPAPRTPTTTDVLLMPGDDADVLHEMGESKHSRRAWKKRSSKKKNRIHHHLEEGLQQDFHPVPSYPTDELPLPDDGPAELQEIHHDKKKVFVWRKHSHSGKHKIHHPPEKDKKNALHPPQFSAKDMLVLHTDKTAAHGKGETKHKKHVWKKHSSVRNKKTHHPLEEPVDLDVCSPVTSTSTVDLPLALDKLDELQEADETMKKMSLWKKHSSVKRHKTRQHLQENQKPGPLSRPVTHSAKEVLLQPTDHMHELQETHGTKTKKHLWRKHSVRKHRTHHPLEEDLMQEFCPPVPFPTTEDLPLSEDKTNEWLERDEHQKKMSLWKKHSTANMDMFHQLLEEEMKQVSLLSPMMIVPHHKTSEHHDKTKKKRSVWKKTPKDRTDEHLDSVLPEDFHSGPMTSSAQEVLALSEDQTDGPQENDVAIKKRHVWKKRFSLRVKNKIQHFLGDKVNQDHSFPATPSAHEVLSLPEGEADDVLVEKDNVVKKKEKSSWKKHLSMRIKGKNHQPLEEDLTQGSSTPVVLPLPEGQTHEHHVKDKSKRGKHLLKKHASSRKNAMNHHEEEEQTQGSGHPHSTKELLALPEELHEKDKGKKDKSRKHNKKNKAHQQAEPDQEQDPSLPPMTHPTEDTLAPPEDKANEQHEKDKTKKKRSVCSSL